MKNPKIVVKNIKEMQGMDSPIFSASVYVNGIRAFSVHNDGWGAPNWYDAFNKRGEELLKLCEDYAKSLPDISTQWSDELGMDLPMDLDILLDDLIAEVQEKKQIKKWCKTKTVFRLPEDKDGSYRTLNHKFDNGTKIYIEKKYPNAVIMNEAI